MNKLRRTILLLCAWFILCAGSLPEMRVRADETALRITADFTSKEAIGPGDPIELQLSRPLAPSEGRLAVLVGATDLTGLMIIGTETLRFEPRAIRLTPGELTVSVYLVAADNIWKEIATFPLRVVQAEAAVATDQPVANGAPAADPAVAPPVRRRFGFDKLEMTPQLNIGFKSQIGETHFPDSNRPERPQFADATLTGTWKSEMARGAMTMSQQFDIVGSSFQNEALRFGDLQNRAPQVDLSSYQMQFQFGTRKLNLGHTSFGAHRHLMNSFSSRGLTFSMPINKRFDVSAVMMNSTNVVGWNNFFGLANRRHQLFGGMVGFEAFEKRPGGLRFEAGVIDAWFTANRQNFNQSNINDAERSQGGSFRVQGKNKSERIRFEGGYTRSRFVNPEDPLLAQGISLVPSRSVTRNARFAEASIDLLKDLSFAIVRPAGETNAADAQTTTPAATPLEPKKLNLTMNIRHEKVDPLFRSIAASAQADLFRNEVEFTGAYGEMSFSASHTRFNDNLAGIQTILRTNTRRTAIAINTPTLGLFSRFANSAPANPYFPRIGYTFERVQASADFLPIGDAFSQPGSIPDLATINQAFNVEWQFKVFRAGYRLNHSIADNRALSRERADLQNFVHGATFGWNPRPTFDLNFEINFEDANNREEANSNRTLRFGINTNWQMTPRQAWNLTFSTLGAGDLLRTNRNRNTEFDLQWSYRLTRENENRFRKYQINYFIRYANRFARNRVFADSLNNVTKLQTFNTGLNFIFF